MKDFKIKFLEEFYGIKKGQIVTFHDGRFQYPDGNYSVTCESPEQFMERNPDLKLEKVEEDLW